MVCTLAVEAILASLLAASLGYYLDRGNGAKVLGGVTLVAVALTMVVALLVARRDLAQPPELVMVEIAIWTYVISGTLGYVLSDLLGVLLAQGALLLATLACVLATALAGRVNEWVGSLALVVAVVVIGVGGTRVFSKILRGKGARPLTVLWFGFCATCLLGYLAAGRAGTFLITIPAQLFFWVFLYYLSGQTLPIEPQDERARTEQHRRNAFKCLLTFALGTNYPYYVIGDWQTRENCELDKPEPRVRGNAFMQFLAGPGIIINDCNHVGVTTTGFRNRVTPPGLSFTGVYEELNAVVDLRPQLRICRDVKAETRDGIVVRTLSFMPHRIGGTDGQQPERGRSFPYNKADVLKAVFDRTLIEHQWGKDQAGLSTEEQKRVPWNELVEIVTPPILKDIILQYTCDELLAPGDPRGDIARSFKERMIATMKPLGIEMIGGGISNIKPPDNVVEKRIQRWQSPWQSRILLKSGETDAQVYKTRGLAWVQSQLRLMSMLGQLQETMEHKGVVGPTLERLLIDSIASLMPEQLPRPDGPIALPDEAPGTARELPDSLPYLLSQGFKLGK